MSPSQLTRRRLLGAMALAGVVPHAFADHHAYQPQDLSFGSQLPVLMTEKDAVKCRGFASDWHYAVPLQAELDRVIPVIEAIRSRIDVAISIDTSKPEVMRAAAVAGAVMINDIGAFVKFLRAPLRAGR